MAEESLEIAETGETDPTVLGSELLVLMDGGGHHAMDRLKISSYDFKHKQPVLPLEMVFFQQIYTTWLRLFRTYVTLTLKTDVQIQQSSLEFKPFQDVMETVEEPVTAVVFGNEHGGEVGYWIFPTVFVLNIVRKLLGGTGKETLTPRALTAIEKNLFWQFMDGCVDHFCQNLYTGVKLENIKIFGVESNLNFLPKPQITLDIFGIQTANWTLDETVFMQSFALPFNLLQPILESFRKEQKKLEPVKDKKKLLWRDIYASIDVPVTVEWTKTVTMKDITLWTEGTVLDFPMNVLEKTILKANGVPKFTGSLGVEAGHVVFNVVAVEDDRNE